MEKIRGIGINSLFFGTQKLHPIGLYVLAKMSNKRIEVICFITCVKCDMMIHLNDVVAPNHLCVRVTDTVTHGHQSVTLSRQ